MRFLPGEPRKRVSRSLQALRRLEERDLEPIHELVSIIRELRQEDPKFVAMLLIKLAEFCYPKPRAEDFDDVDNAVTTGPTEEQIKKLWNMKQTAEEFSERKVVTTSEGKSRTD